MRLGFVVLFCIALSVPVAESCDCVPKRSVADEFKAADAVFVGTLLGELLGEQESDDDWGGRQTLLFAVHAGYKNVAAETVELMNRTHSTCAHEFVREETYLIYAFETTKGELHTHTCSRTAQVDEGYDDFEMLPEPTYIKEE
jgi:hypothetical protein